MKNEERRWFLKRLSQTIGGVTATALVAGNGISSALAYQVRKNSADSNGVVLTQRQMQILRDVCSIVIPRTDTPSAADLDCHGFIDHQISQCHSLEEQQSVRRCLNDINLYSLNEHQLEYIQLASEQQTEILVNVEQMLGFTQAQKDDFKFVKGLMVFGYFTSEVGATQVLAYQAVPGGYKASVPITPETKTWGSLNYY